MKKKKIVIIAMVLILVVLTVLTLINFKEQNSTAIRPSSSQDLEVTPDLTPIPTLAPHTEESVATEEDFNSAESTPYTSEDLCIMGIKLDMSLQEVESLLGEPLNKTEEYSEGISGYLLEYEYDFGGVRFYRTVNADIAESYVNSVFVNTLGVNSPWAIEIGDSIKEVFSKINIAYDPVIEKEYKIIKNGELIGEIGYTYVTRDEVSVIRIYYGEKNMLNYFVVSFDNNIVDKYAIVIPHY